MAEKTGSNSFDLLRGAFWPVVGLVILYAFYTPIYGIFDALSLRASSIEKVKLGELELNIKVRDLPTPTTVTARVLPKFNEGMIVVLIDMTGSGGPCFKQDATRANDPRFDAFSALADLKLIDFYRSSTQGGVCDVAYEAKLTPDGKATRQFLMDLLTTQIVSSSASNK